MPQILSPCMSCWVSAYSYRLAYKLGSTIGHADAVSCCPLPATDQDPAPAASILLIEELDSPIAAADVTQASHSDPLIWVTGVDWVHRSWLHGSLPPEFQPYYRRQHELSTQKGCLLWGHRVVIPPCLCCNILEYK